MCKLATAFMKRDHYKLLRESDYLKRVREKQELEVTSRTVAWFPGKMGGYSMTLRVADAPESGGLQGAHTLLKMGVRTTKQQVPGSTPAGQTHT